jgi:hypothetical protein
MKKFDSVFVFGTTIKHHYPDGVDITESQMIEAVTARIKDIFRNDTFEESVWIDDTVEIEPSLHVIHGTKPNLEGSSLRGHLSCSYEDLAEEFGPPDLTGVGDSSRDAGPTWDLDVRRMGFPSTSTPISVYAIKDEYYFRHQENVERISSWSIGGHTDKVVDLLRSLLEQKDIQFEIRKAS